MATDDTPVRDWVMDSRIEKAKELMSSLNAADKAFVEAFLVKHLEAVRDRIIGMLEDRRREDAVTLLQTEYRVDARLGGLIVELIADMNGIQAGDDATLRNLRAKIRGLGRSRALVAKLSEADRAAITEFLGNHGEDIKPRVVGMLENGKQDDAIRLLQKQYGMDARLASIIVELVADMNGIETPVAIEQLLTVPQRAKARAVEAPGHAP